MFFFVFDRNRKQKKNTKLVSFDEEKYVFPLSKQQKMKANFVEHE